MKDVDVPVIGGHAGITILPLLSQVRASLQGSGPVSLAGGDACACVRACVRACVQTTPPVTFSEAEKKALTEKIQNAGGHCGALAGGQFMCRGRALYCAGS